jgi:hypothetical protein
MSRLDNNLTANAIVQAPKGLFAIAKAINRLADVIERATAAMNAAEKSDLA